jgi:hypothetical protein
LIFAISLPAATSIIFTLITKEKPINYSKMTDDNFIILVPSIIKTIGIICESMFGIVVIFFTISSQTLPHIVFYIIFGFGMYIGMYLILKAVKWKVSVKDDLITVDPIFLKQYTFKFNDIISVKRQVKKNNLKSERIVIRTRGGKKLIVESLEISYWRLVKKIKKSVREEVLSGF